MSTLPPENIVLIGFMGSGKSSVGRELARLLGYPLVDTDALVAKRAGKSIPRIFAEDGEETFRDLESRVLSELHARRPTHQVIATGGGIVTRPRNRDLLRRLGYVVWLVVSPEEILHRTSLTGQRPLLNTADPKSTVSALLAERTPLYRQASHLTIETDSLNFLEISAGIIESARYFFAHSAP